MIIILLFFIIMKKVNTMFLLVYIKIWDYSFGSIFVQKYIVSLSVFFFFNLILIFEKNERWCNFFIFVKPKFSSKLKLNKDGLICWYNWHNPSVKFDQKSFFYFKKYNKKYQSTSISKILEPNWNLKKLEK